MLLSIFGLAWLLGVAHSQSINSCQHAFILYNNAKNITELARFSDYVFPSQYILDQSKLPVVGSLTLVASLCNNVPMFQSVLFTVYNYTPPSDFRMVSSPQLSISGDFLKSPGVYYLSATSFSQGNHNEGLTLESMSAIISVYRTCLRGFHLYNTINQSVIGRFPDVGFHSTDFGVTSSATQGTIDLLRQSPSIQLNLVAEFCNPRVKSVTFTKYNSIFVSSSNTTPFSVGPKRRSTLLPSGVLKEPTQRFANFVATAQNNVDAMTIQLNVVPANRIINFTLVNANTGTDIVTVTDSFKVIFSDTPAAFLEVDLGNFSSNASFSLRANVGGSGKNQSVRFSLYDSISYASYGYVANATPFALAGISKSGRYNPVAALSSPSSYTMEAFPLEGMTTGPNHYLYISVLSRTRITSLTFVETTSNKNIKVYSSVPPNNLFGPFPRNIFELDPLLYPVNATFTIVANSSWNVGSVEFNLSTYYSGIDLLSYVDNTAPFALGGKSQLGRYNAVPALRAPYDATSSPTFELKVTPFSQQNKKGFAGPTLKYSINVRPDYRINKLTVVDAAKGTNILDIVGWDTSQLDLSKFSGNAAFAIQAFTAGRVGSIDFSFCGIAADTCDVTRVENGPTFALAGVSTSGQYNKIASLRVPGKYRIDAVPYSEKNKGGYIGEKWTVSIEVL